MRFRRKRPRTRARCRSLLLHGRSLDRRSFSSAGHSYPQLRRSRATACRQNGKSHGCDRHLRRVPAGPDCAHAVHTTETPHGAERLTIPFRSRIGNRCTHVVRLPRQDAHRGNDPSSCNAAGDDGLSTGGLETGAQARQGSYTPLDARETELKDRPEQEMTTSSVISLGPSSRMTKR